MFIIVSYKDQKLLVFSIFKNSSLINALDLLFTIQYIMSIFKAKYTDSEAQFLTQILPEGYSCQQFILQEERAFRQRKLKKIDDIYASDFSLRVLKKKHSEKDVVKDNKQKPQEKKTKNMQYSNESKKSNNNAVSLPKITSAEKIITQQDNNNQDSIKQSSSRRQIKQPKSYQKILQESQKRNKNKKSSPKIVDKTSVVIQDAQPKFNEESSQQNHDQNLPNDESLNSKAQSGKKTPRKELKMMDEQEQNENKLNSKQKSLQFNQQEEEMKQNQKGSKKNSWEQKCNEILQKLKVHKSSWPFRRPVDPIAQGVPNYLQVIKEPMDLKTIEKKFKSNSYANENDFHIDVKKIFKNSYIFNPKQSIFFLHTVDFQKYYQQLVKEYQNYPNHLNMKDKQKSKEEQFNQKQFSKGSSKKQDPSTPKNKKVSRKDQGEKDQNENDSSPSNINFTQMKKTTSQRKESGKKTSFVQKNQNAQQKINPILISGTNKQVEKTVKKNSILNPPKKDLPISTIQKEKLFYRISLLSNEDLQLMVKLVNGDKYDQFQQKQEIQFDLKDMSLEQIMQLKKFVYEKTQETIKNQQMEQSKINSGHHNRIVAEDQIEN